MKKAKTKKGEHMMPNGKIMKDSEMMMKKKKNGKKPMKKKC